MRYLCLSILVLGSLAAQAQQPPVALPPGEGREIVQAACTQCHAPLAFTQMRAGPAAWRSMVYDMILRGAQVRRTEMDTVVTYLATNFAPGRDAPQARAPITLPEGEGKVLVEQLCSLCHGLDRAAGTRRAPSEWDAILERMRFLGTPLGDGQLETIRTYLNEHAGR